MKMVFGSFFISKYIINGNKNRAKNNRIFICNSCDYSTSINSNYNAHILTLKYKNCSFGNNWK